MTTPKRPRDPNQLAKFIVDAVTGDEPKPIPTSPSPQVLGGRARALHLNSTKRTEIAKKAADTRWNKSQNKSEV